MISRILRLIFFCVLIIVTHIDCHSVDKESSLSKLKLDIIRKGNYCVGNTKFLTIELKITNLSDDTMRFWISTCGYLNNVVLKSNYYEIVPPLCDSNNSELISLKKNQSIYLPITIQFKTRQSDIVENDKIGFLIIFKDQYRSDMSEKLTDISLRLRRNERQMIWSENTISNSYYRPFYIDK